MNNIHISSESKRMKLPDLNSLEFFRIIAQEKSFTKAGKKLNLTQSALSHRMKTLEESLRIRLLNRSTRSLTLTEAGRRLLEHIEYSFNHLEDTLSTLQSDYHQISGLIRIDAPPIAAELILWPKIEPLLKKYPALQIEINVEPALGNIISRGFDAGVRLGERLEMNMISLPISPPQRMIPVVSKNYFQNKPIPEHPKDLAVQECLALRFPSGEIYQWEFEKAGQKIEMMPAGQLIASQSYLILQAALKGQGIGFLPEILAAPHLESGQLETFLKDWCPYFEGYHFYYPSKKHHSAAFSLLMKNLAKR